MADKVQSDVNFNSQLRVNKANDYNPNRELVYNFATGKQYYLTNPKQDFKKITHPFYLDSKQV